MRKFLSISILLVACTFQSYASLNGQDALKFPKNTTIKDLLDCRVCGNGEYLKEMLTNSFEEKAFRKSGDGTYGNVYPINPEVLKALVPLVKGND